MDIVLYVEKQVQLKMENIKLNQSNQKNQDKITAIFLLLYQEKKYMKDIIIGCLCFYVEDSFADYVVLEKENNVKEQ